MSNKSETSVIKAVIWGVILYSWDALILGLPVIGLFIAAVAFLSNGLFAIAKFIKRERDIAPLYAYKVAIYVITAVAILGTHSFNTNLGESNANRIIYAVSDYRAEHGKYPETLEELVPKYLDNVPRSSVRLIANKYRYWGKGSHYNLMWVKVPPFFKKTYDFESERWGALD